MGVAGLAVGVVLGALGHMMVQWPLVRKTELAFGFVTDIDWLLVRRVITVALPRAFTLAWGQTQLLILVTFASTMTIGSVAVFQFAYNLQSVPLAIIGMSYSVAAFPVLADLLARSEREKFLSYVTTALRHIMFWAIPIAALVIVLRAQLVRVLLGSGSFNWEDTRLTAAALALFALALVGQSIALLLVRAFYAGGYTKIPFYVVAAGSGLGAASAFWLLTLYHTLPAFADTVTSLLRLYGVSGGEVLMLPLGFVLGVVAEVILLLFFFARKFKFSLHTLVRPFFTALLAGVVGAQVAYLTLSFIVEGVNQEKFIGIFIQGGVAGLLGLCGVIASYALLRSPELEEIIKAFRARLFKTDVVAPQPDIL
jgi:putative peptidoglycan lipid II flippase